MKTLILINIFSSNTVYRLNEYIRLNKKKLGNVKVFFCAQTESNRFWTVNEKPIFFHKILPHHEIRIQGKDLFTYFINPTILNDIEKFNPDRIVITGWDQFAYQLAFLWAKFRHKRITLWSGSTANEPSWRRKLMALPVRLLVKLTSDYIVYGQRARDYLISLGGDPSKIEIFINDVNGSYFRSEAKRLSRNKSKLRNQFGILTQKNIIYIGQLIRRKGIADLLEAYKKFTIKQPGWGLIVVGYGHLESQMKEMAWRSDLDNIYFLGSVDQYDLPTYYALANVLILPSHEEVWGLVVNEALHSGLKVIVSDHCGCAPDLVKPGNNGYIYQSGDTKALVKAMLATSALTT